MCLVGKTQVSGNISNSLVSIQKTYAGFLHTKMHAIIKKGKSRVFFTDGIEIGAGITECIRQFFAGKGGFPCLFRCG